MQVKKGIKRYGLAVKEIGAGILLVSRYPMTGRSIYIMTAAWALAAALSIWSVGRYLLEREFGAPLLYVNTGCLVLDIFMLRQCIHGLIFRRQIRRRGRRRALP